jgi:hypothetical protein
LVKDWPNTERRSLTAGAEESLAQASPLRAELGAVENA